jgi:signal transduction histidine kinase
MTKKSIKESEEKASIYRQAYEEQMAVNRLKEDIISNISHELRTPLAICMSTIELTMNEEAKEERQKLLGMAREALERQDKIIGNLVDVEMIHRGAFELNIESIDLEQLIIISKKEIEPLALKNKILIKTKVQKDLPSINADINKLKHVFFDLLDNAIKFNKKGGEVIIEAKQMGNKVEVSIKDTGIGIPKEHLDRIFDRLYQVDSSPRRKYGGVGLGLAIVKDIIKRFGGEIQIESKPNKGSKFTFTLPIHGIMPLGKTTELPEEFIRRFPSLASIKHKKI